MKTQLTLIITLAIIVSCNTQQRNCQLKGTLENAPDSTTLFLTNYENKKLVDSIKVLNGKIDFKVQLSTPRKFYLHNRRNKYEFRDRKIIWLEPSEITINGDYRFLKNLEVLGSEMHSEFEDYILLINNANKQINTLREQIHFKSNEEKKKDSLKIEWLQENLIDSITSFLLNKSNSYVTLTSLYEECCMAYRHLNKKQIKNIYQNLSEELKSLKQGVEIKEYINLPDPPKVGDIAPEIQQVTPKGDTISLSDYRGKYVLLDFWDSRCAPCRGSHKWLRRIYKKFNSKGFEIIGISGDTEKRRWVNAIKQDSIEWVNISDLKGWRNEAFLIYDVKFIPQNYLINPDGKIIKYRLCNESSADYELDLIFSENNNGL
ncbi:MULTISPECIES: redoxin domain-containing protein [unclassified Carboxylicivirga]|uniref:redoxin domain-containing protein n=1 Tax=Carboxylicivirga TaxID=1628153 RepID=UPI003D33B68A